ncbi:diguanylate cyclase [uncultured Campylobacter sp.]|uniref:bile resistance response regulator CbrR n=1 Tax=uncultured Campylobacter sp. TaxID=218934 RepID=UPI002630CB3D|nr:diguanylate cyclase [uncultured Campylobacter sp.]
MSGRILIIDDNKMLTKLLAKKLDSIFGFGIDIAFSFAEAKSLLENSQDYFVCFADLCLPDALNGEIVDFLIEKSLLVVVLTANSDEKIKQKFLDKDIFSYIYKESNTCIDQIVSTVELLKTFQKFKVILAMSNLNERNYIKNLLSLRQFQILVAAHGEEALSYLNDNTDTNLIICDAKMPVVDGIDLLSQIREDYPKTQLGVIVLGDKNDSLEVSFLRGGANEFIEKPFSKELFNARLDRYLQEKKDQLLMEHFNYLDPLTGAKKAFYLKNSVDDYINDKSENESFAFAIVDIDNLRSINAEYGYNIGDEVIRTVVKEILNETYGRDIVGHFSRDKICVLLKNTSSEQAIRVLSSIRTNIKNKGVLVSLDEVFFTVSIGVTFSSAKTSYEELIHKAQDALSIAKNAGKDRVEVCF